MPHAEQFVGTLLSMRRPSLLSARLIGRSRRGAVRRLSAIAALTATLVVPIVAAHGGTASAALNKPIVGMASTQDGNGYWQVASDGGVFSYGDARFFGSTGNLHLVAPIVGMAATPDSGGYWLVAADGGIFAFGDAKFFGSTGGQRLNKPIVGMAATPDGGGYYLVASDGGVFAFGDAVFRGSTGSLHLVAPVVAMSTSPDGGGYWLVASDGGVFSYGDAAFHGSTGGLRLVRPVVGLVSTSDGGGYWMAASDGGIFAFGDASFQGSMGGQALSAPVVGLTAHRGGGGYTLVGADGATYSFPTSPSVSTSTSSSGAPSSTGGLALGLSGPPLITEGAAAQAADVATVRSIGIGWVRVEATWNVIQPTAGAGYNWSILDQAVASAESGGLHVELVVDSVPTWAQESAAGGSVVGAPASAAAYGAFAGAVAARYGPRGVSDYEIWNEPNIAAEFAPGPDPVLYTAMLKASYAAIKAVQPGATVISGGLAPDGQPNPSGTAGQPFAGGTPGDYNPVDFLIAMYQDGAKGSFDALGYHAYSYPVLADTYEIYSGWSQMGQTNPSLRSVMTANGDAQKQIWITEVGAPSAGPDGVGTAAQATEMSQVVAAARATPWIGALFVYNYRDAATDPDYFGLLNADGSPKPAWNALAAAIAG